MRGRCRVFVLVVAALAGLSHATGASQAVGEVNADGASPQVRASGRIVDSQDRPVAGATVTLYQMVRGETMSAPRMEVLQETVTGGDGAYSFTLDQGTGRFLVARKEGLALGWGAWSGSAEQQSDIVLGEPKDLAGDVVDEEGRPIAGAEVGIAFAMLGQGEVRRVLAAPSLLSTKTDDRGRFVFADLPAEATFEFLVRRGGRVTLNTLLQTFFRDLFDDSSSPPSVARLALGPSRCQFTPGQTGIKLVLPLAAGIEGTVVEETTGRPVGGMRVRARGGSGQDGLVPPDPVLTAEDGSFRIGGLAAGDWTVESATSRGQTAEWVAEPVSVSLRAGEMKTGVRLELTKGGFIEVLVQGVGGKPVVRAHVRVWGEQHELFGGLTDANGLTRIRVPAGRYRVHGPYEPGYVLEIREERVAVEEGETKRVGFVLRAAPTIAGTVRDELGIPLAGVKIEGPFLPGQAVTTDAQGKFVVPWSPVDWRRPGTTSILVARDLARNLAQSVEINEQTGNLDLVLKPGGMVTGTVLDLDGKPLPGARIVLMPEFSRRSAPFGSLEEVTVGADGRFRIEALPPERQYNLIAMADGYGSSCVSACLCKFNDNHQDVGRFRLMRADLSISGVVVDPQGWPVADAEVSVSDGNFPPRRDVKTDADGRFVVPGVPAGSVSLTATCREPPLMYSTIEANGGAAGVVIVLSE